MPSCEKCWRDSHASFGDQVERYHELIAERECTPEQQAGPEAGDCPKCERKTLHQHCRVCMSCGYDPALAPTP